MNIEKIKTDFPFFQHHPTLAYLDSGATALKPKAVIDAMNKYYEEYPVNVHRGIYNLSGFATDQYENARKTIATFINATPEEIIFTSGATHGLNLLATVLGRELKEGDNIVLTRMEHHANMVPWQQIAKEKKVELRFIEIQGPGEIKELKNYRIGDYTIDIESAKKLIDERTKIVSVTSVSNVLGTIVPVKEIIELVKKVGAYTIVDHSQGVVHLKTDVQDLDCDFLVFSGHKLYGPTGIGVVYGKKVLLEKLEPFFFGGDMIRFVSYEDATWADVPNKFEAGTPNIAGAIGLGATIEYINSVGWEAIDAHEKELTAYAMEKLKNIVKIIGTTDLNQRTGVISFLIDDIHPHDTGDIFNSCNVAVRVGHHCAMPLVRHLGIGGTVRASFGMYNSKEDVDALVTAIGKVKEIFKA